MLLEIAVVCGQGGGGGCCGSVEECRCVGDEAVGEGLDFRLPFLDDGAAEAAVHWGAEDEGLVGEVAGVSIAADL